MQKYISQFEIDQMNREVEEFSKKIDSTYISQFEIEESNRKVEKWARDLGID